MPRSDVIKELLLAGYEPYVMNQEELGRYVVSEKAKWAKVIQEAHLTMQ
jgi:tripartite-type tricarboxylate transporter receptor subunit TctC